MIHDLKPYSKYKDSGVPWLGEIPNTWRVLRGKNVFRVIDVRSETGDEELLTVSSKDGVVPRSQTNVTMFKAESYIGHKLCWPGDLVINSLWAWMQGLGFTKIYGLVSSAYSVYRPLPEFSSYTKYFDYTLRSAAYKWELQTRSKGVWLSRLQLSDPAFLDMPIIIPPADEQSAIVRYLDHFDRRIRHYIRSKKKLIKLLEEQKQAIIHQAVTLGLDPNVKLKPSGIEWLGEIPEHWEVLPLKALSTVQSGITLGKQYLGQKLVEFPYLRVANVQEGHVNLSEIKTIEVPVEEATRSRLQKGDVLMTEGGDPDKLGRGCVWEGQISPCLHQNHIFAVRPNISRLKPYYLGILLSSQYSKEYFLRTGKQTTNLASTNKTTIGQFPIPLPKIEEQDLILGKVENDLEGIERAISGISREISILHEYRTRLIADVVTGKLDVREAAANLPAETELTGTIELEEDLEETNIQQEMNEVGMQGEVDV